MSAIKKFLAIIKVAKKQKSPKVTLSVKDCELLGEELENLQEKIKKLKEVHEKYRKLENKSSKEETKPTDDDVIIVKMEGEKFK